MFTDTNVLAEDEGKMKIWEGAEIFETYPFWHEGDHGWNPEFSIIQSELGYIASSESGRMLTLYFLRHNT